MKYTKREESKGKIVNEKSRTYECFAGGGNIILEGEKNIRKNIFFGQKCGPPPVESITNTIIKKTPSSCHYGSKENPPGGGGPNITKSFWRKNMKSRKIKKEKL